MSIHKELAFEDEVCVSLAAHGWLYADKSAEQYDRTLALYPEDVVGWVKQTQPDAWDTLTKNYGATAEATLLKGLRKTLDQMGALSVLRDGVDIVGLKSKLKMAQFKPPMTMNPDIVARYDANRLRVVRQVRYSLHNQNSIDLVLFLNGIPVATIELKTDFTQNIQDAVDQYRFDRDPSPAGQSPEPLLSFLGGALVHFAVSSREVMMTTKLQGKATTFLPFNLGNNGAKGNPTNPDGIDTAYLWESILQPDSWLEILGRYLIGEKDDKNQLTKVIFPRYHQLDATRKLQQAILAEGPGYKYLIQHSAGSGKTNSIAWSAHFLADLHNADNEKVFDSVLVVSDRNVIDGQLQDAIYSFERTVGVVATIKGEQGSKSKALAEALAGDKKIVVCTIQTFPHAIAAVNELAATQGKRFAVIADEAHSSQSGSAAADLKRVLSAEELAELNDGGEVSGEDIMAAQMAARATEKGVTFVAFTATPKAKTMELFGRRPDPMQPAGDGNLPTPFHVYSMRQAIEEGFILDVLRNYTSYKLAFKLANGGNDIEDKEVERSTAMKGLMGWVRLHPYNISQKVQIIVEHYREMVAPLLAGKAKAMVVVGSRKEAVRWQLAIEKYIKEKGYWLKTLVAFSGEVNDPESGPEPFRESSADLNPGLKGRDIREVFKGDEYQILLVANKFQTGFDQPLLCAMYVDKRLAGIQAVQTLSRLNRCYPGKDTTYVLDFVNEPDEVLEAFKTYFTTATLSDVTDPDIILQLRNKLDAAGYYDEFEIERVVKVQMDPKATQSQLVKAVGPVANRLVNRFKDAKGAFKLAKESENADAMSKAKDQMDALILFKTDITTYERAYTFLSQIFDYGNTDFEKRSIFYRYLVRLLDFGREREGVDLSQVVLTHHLLRNRGKQPMQLPGVSYPTLDPMSEIGSGQVQEKEKAYLTEIISKLNEVFGKDTTDGDQLSYARTLRDKALESETLQKQAANNSKEQFASSPDLFSEVTSAIIDSMDAQQDLSKRALDSKAIQNALVSLLLNHLGLYEALREKAA